MSKQQDPQTPLTPEEIEKKKAKKEQKKLKKNLDQEKTFLAFDRTLLAWIRTGSSLLTFGFAIMKLMQEEARKPGEHPILQVVNPVFVGWLMIFSGFLGLVLAVINYVKFARKFGRKSSAIYGNPSMIIAYVLILLCFTILISPLIKALATP